MWVPVHAGRLCVLPGLRAASHKERESPMMLRLQWQNLLQRLLQRL
ncbi:hypothetical protein [Pantoea sp. GD03673]|nr:hypothetical protein [Pantoea sp. GD03673]MDH2066987.1 hypothetical protein [Pantoea sp. GD03673]